jgi:hypothetical protein
MDETRSTSKSRQKKPKLIDLVSDKARCAAWAKTLRRCEWIAMKASGTACKVFTALKIHADMDGYCWPLISTLQAGTNLKKRDTIFAALRELEALGIVDRGSLSSRKGRNSPTLYRIGGRVEKLPPNAATQYFLNPRRAKKSSMRARVKMGRRPSERDLAAVPPNVSQINQPGEITNAVLKPQSCGDVPSAGTTEVPSNGIQNYSRELPQGGVTSLWLPVPQPSLNTPSAKDAAADPLECWESIGSNLGIGVPGFQELWRFFFSHRNEAPLSEAMERCCQAWQRKHRAVPTPFLECKRAIEAQEKSHQHPVRKGRSTNGHESFRERERRDSFAALGRQFPDGVAALASSLPGNVSPADLGPIDRVLRGIAQRSIGSGIGRGVPSSDEGIGLHADGRDDQEGTSPAAGDRPAIDVHPVSRSECPGSDIVGGRGSPDREREKENWAGCESKDRNSRTT